MGESSGAGGRAAEGNQRLGKLVARWPTGERDWAMVETGPSGLDRRREDAMEHRGLLIIDATIYESAAFRRVVFGPDDWCMVIADGEHGRYRSVREILGELAVEGPSWLITDEAEGSGVVGNGRQSGVGDTPLAEFWGNRGGSSGTDL